MKSFLYQEHEHKLIQPEFEQIMESVKCIERNTEFYIHLRKAGECTSWNLVTEMMKIRIIVWIICGVMNTITKSLTNPNLFQLIWSYLLNIKKPINNFLTDNQLKFVKDILALTIFLWTLTIHFSWIYTSSYNNYILNKCKIRT